MIELVVGTLCWVFMAAVLTFLSLLPLILLAAAALAVAHYTYKFYNARQQKNHEDKL